MLRCETDNTYDGTFYTSRDVTEVATDLFFVLWRTYDMQWIIERKQKKVWEGLGSVKSDIHSNREVCRFTDDFFFFKWNYKMEKTNKK